MLTIYLIQSGPDGPIKVALTSGPAIQRLQAGNPQRLTVRAIYEAEDRTDLRDLHETWAPHNLRADWFTPTILDLPVDLHAIDFDQATQQRRLDRDAEQEQTDRAAMVLAHLARTSP